MAYTKKVRTAFLAAYRRLGTIEGAAKAVGVSREVHYDWKRKDAAYREAFEAASDPVADLYVDEVVNRAIHGWIEPVFSNGKRAVDFEVDEKGDLVKGPDGKFKSRPASVLKKSDACLLALCAARVPGFSQKATGGGGRTGSAKDEDDRDIEVTVVYKDKPPAVDDPEE